MQTVAVYLLHATLSLWATPGTVVDQEMQVSVSAILSWLSKAAHTGKLKAWKTRDTLVQLLEKYVDSDPAESQWQINFKLGIAPMDILLEFVRDEDIRVRFRTGIALPHVFVTSEKSRQNLEGVYDHIKNLFPINLHQYVASLFTGTRAQFLLVSGTNRWRQDF
jgi:hypothetical protein